MRNKFILSAVVCLGLVTSFTADLNAGQHIVLAENNNESKKTPPKKKPVFKFDQGDFDIWKNRELRACNSRYKRCIESIKKNADKLWGVENFDPLVQDEDNVGQSGVWSPNSASDPAATTEPKPKVKFPEPEEDSGPGVFLP